MESPAWLPREVKLSTSQVPVSGTPAGVPAGAPLVPVPVAATPTSDSPSGAASDSMQEPSQVKFANAPSHVVPVPSFTYNVPSNANMSSGGTQQSSPSSVSTNIYCFPHPSCRMRNIIFIFL